MMNWLVSTSLHLRVIVVALAVLLMIVGFASCATTPLDVFPEFAPPLVEIQTEAPGLSTAEVESLITDADRERAQRRGAIEDAALKVSARPLVGRLDLSAGHGPDARAATRAGAAGAGRAATARGRAPPVILQPLSSTSRAMKIGVSSKTLSQMELSALARWTIRPRLMAVPGVANVAIWGQRDRQFQVLVDPDRLRAHNVTLDDVVRATRDAVAVGRGRLRGHAESAAAGRAPVRRHAAAGPGARPGGFSQRRAARTRRRRRSRRRIPAADRRRGDQRRAGRCC